MKVRYLLAALFLVLELPVLLPLAAGALLTGLIRGAGVLCSQAGRIVRVRRPFRRVRAERLGQAALGH